MQQLIIGSTALQRLIPGTRTPKDIDALSPTPAEGVDAFWDERLADWIPAGTNRHATLDELYTLKVSHSYWELRNGSWNKHMFDVVALKRAGAVLDLELHNLLYRVWEDEHGKKIVDLTQESDEFFTDAVRRRYVHDSLHESVAYGDRPLYESVLKDGKSVQMDMQKLRAMPFEDQVRLFREEIYVTALERLMVPNNYQYSPSRAYAWALRRTITSLTKGWSARFLVENFEVFRRPDVDYVAVHLANEHKLIELEDAA
ncbi:hypothetical protein ACH47B_13165 [Rhodococcus sp. NPDC019627]|uniref:DUF7275 domain-containing protein n=1 Tax=unclassified Rhodococcus (in: high G+C Gram-positive bacteria) TaxID=192944 RepID=UPI0033C0789D